MGYNSWGPSLENPDEYRIQDTVFSWNISPSTITVTLSQFLKS